MKGFASRVRQRELLTMTGGAAIRLRVDMTPFGELAARAGSEIIRAARSAVHYIHGITSITSYQRTAAAQTMKATGRRFALRALAARPRLLTAASAGGRGVKGN